MYGSESRECECFAIRCMTKMSRAEANVRPSTENTLPRNDFFVGSDGIVCWVPSVWGTEEKFRWGWNTFSRREAVM